MSSPFNASTTNSLQASFMALLPRIETQARIYFRGIKCSVKKSDFIAEVVAIAWKWYCRLAKRGKDASQFMSALASLAARAVWSGRRVCGQERANEVMSSLAQRRHGFVVIALPPVRESHEALYGTSRGQQIQDALEERLHDNTVTPVPDQAAFRIDFPRWLCRQRHRDRRVIRDMMHGERTKLLASKYHLSPGRISQLRRELHNSWREFHGD